MTIAETRDSNHAALIEAFGRGAVTRLQSGNFRVLGHLICGRTKRDGGGFSAIRDGDLKASGVGPCPVSAMRAALA
jgi:hypothetical protein